VCTPACLLAASISVETVTPPTWWDWPSKNYYYCRTPAGDVKWATSLPDWGASFRFCPVYPPPSRALCTLHRPLRIPTRDFAESHPPRNEGWSTRCPHICAERERVWHPALPGPTHHVEKVEAARKAAGSGGRTRPQLIPPIPLEVVTICRLFGLSTYRLAIYAFS